MNDGKPKHGQQKFCLKCLKEWNKLVYLKRYTGHDQKNTNENVAQL